VRLIRTEADHQPALAEIATVMNPGKDAPDAIGWTFLQRWSTPVKRHISRSKRRVRVADVLKRLRAPTPPMIRRLCGHLNIPTDILVQPYKVMRPVPWRHPTPKPGISRRHRPARSA